MGIYKMKSFISSDVRKTWKPPIVIFDIFLVAPFHNIRYHKCQNYDISWPILMFSMTHFWPVKLRVDSFFTLFTMQRTQKRESVLAYFVIGSPFFLKIGCNHALLREFGWSRIVKSHSILSKYDDNVWTFDIQFYTR